MAARFEVLNTARIRGGVMLAIVDVVNKYLSSGIPPVYEATTPLGRFREGAMALVWSAVFDVVEERVPSMQQLQLPVYFAFLGWFKLGRAAIDMVTGAPHATIKGDGTVALEPADTATAVYMSDGASVSQVTPGKVASKDWFKFYRYVVIGQKNVFYTEAPIKLAL